MKREQGRKLIAFVLCFIMLFSQIQPIYAAQNLPLKSGTKSEDTQEPTTKQLIKTPASPDKTDSSEDYTSKEPVPTPNMLPIQTAPDSMPQVQTAPGINLPLEEIFIKPKIKSPEAPATFNVNYKLQDNVVLVDNKLGTVLENLKLPEELNTNTQVPGIRNIDKLEKSALVDNSLFASQIPGYEKDKVYFDSVNGVAMKTVEKVKLRQPGAASASNFVSLKRPQLNEVFKDFEITKQSIKLTKGNVSGYANGVEECTIKREFHPNIELEQSRLEQLKTRKYIAYNGRMLTSMLSGEKGKEEYVPKHLSDPLVEFRFNDVPLAAYDEDGFDVEITLDGYLGIDSITVDAGYEFVGDYYFTVNTGQELNLTVNAEIRGQKDLIVPIFGIDLDAKIARITGGIFLVVGVNGDIEIVTSVTQWAKNRLGVEGSTVVYLPTPPKPICEFYDKGVDVDVSLAGEINMDMRAGVILGLEVLGWECVGAAALAGIGMNCVAQDLIINIDVYFIVDIYATLFGKRIDIYNDICYLYQMQKPNTKGYRIVFNEACAYRDSVWGHIAKWTGPSESEGVKDFKGNLEITFRRTEGEDAGYTKTFPVSSDSKGNFVLTNVKQKGFDMRKGDMIWVSKVNFESLGEAYVTTTFPFNFVTIDYADFFNDEAKGYVSQAKVRKWPSDEYEYITYRGNVEPVVENTNFTKPPFYAPGICDEKGEFTIYYPFRPEHLVSGMISSDGFSVMSWNKVKPDVSFTGKRIVEPIDRKQYTDEDGRPVDQRREIEHFLVINQRGTKKVDTQGHYDSYYSIYSPGSYHYDPISGRPWVPPVTVGSREFNERIVPLPDAKGTSVLSKNYTTEWSWNGYSSSGAVTFSPTGQLQMGVNASSQLQPAEDWASQLQLEDSWISQAELIPISFTYASEEPKPAEDHFMDIDKMIGLNSIVRQGKVTFYHEGEAIEVYDPEDIGEPAKGRKMEHINNPVAELMINRIWSRINMAKLNTMRQFFQSRQYDAQQLPGAGQMNPGDIMQ
ncbi:MAG TPA: hypothetical protein PK223_00430 [Bacillota bacterium]|nr:hypothetical protein [Bacillota bacterium]